MKSKEVLVSISCITYNHVQYIRQCLDGFLMQHTNFAFEVLIHDDCSTDGTTEIIKEYELMYPDIIKPIYEKENQYQQGKPSGSVVWNFPRAQGKYIALCEGDDYWTDPLKLQKQVDFLEANPDYGMCYTQSRVFYQSSNVFGPIFGGETPNTFASIANENRIPTQTVIFKADQLRKYIYEIDSTGKGWKMGDYPMYLWFAANSKIHFISTPTAVYRCLPCSASHFKTRSQWIRFRIHAFEISKYFVEKYDPSLIHMVNAILLWYRFELAIFETNSSDIKTYRSQIIKLELSKNEFKHKLLIIGSYCPQLYVMGFNLFKWLRKTLKKFK